MGIPSETSEQIALVKDLNRAKIHHIHVPMGGSRSRSSGRSMRRLGARRGFPDLLIFTAPGGSDVAGYAIELKRTDGGAKATKARRAWLQGLERQGWWPALTASARGRLLELATDDQQRELLALKAEGWEIAVCCGRNHALVQLRSWGFDI